MATEVVLVRKRARVSGRAVLAAVLTGEALEDIAKSKQITKKRAEKLLREELRKRWIAPAQDFARLQIARLEAIARLLKDQVNEGELPAIDRLLKVIDRLDRYHGFSKFARLALPAQEDMLPRLMGKMGQAAQEQVNQE